MDKKNVGSLDFPDCITIWGTITKGTKQEQFQCLTFYCISHYFKVFFSLNDTDGDNKLNELELREFVEELHYLFLG